ncbi:hypothetical protein AC579_10369 [Pseudocercospora musae]|uniref:Uncharacterized protein n=1 Tax=Pseudocercospora musae TaxID=113226 RepID=A0A139GZN2_9PEZI|nr:hypothetical protein AC579_10369 [Pseudocercospora musae]
MRKVKAIRTANNSIATTPYVDRRPPEALFAPDTRTVWIGTRAVSSVEIIDGMNVTMLGRITTGKGPRKVLFGPDGQTAYVDHIMDLIIAVIDVPRQMVKYNITCLQFGKPSNELSQLHLMLDGHLADTAKSSPPVDR